MNVMAIVTFCRIIYNLRNFEGDQRVWERTFGFRLRRQRTPQDLRPPGPDHRRVVQPRRHGHCNGLYRRPGQVLSGERQGDDLFESFLS